MIDFLKNKSIVLYDLIAGVADSPNLLFSNDPNQNLAEADNNLFTMQDLNKLIKRKRIDMSELVAIFRYIEDRWTEYLKRYYTGKNFIFYLWGDHQIPAIRFCIISCYAEDQKLPFGRTLKQYEQLDPILVDYQNKAFFEGIPVFQEEDSTVAMDIHYRLLVYSRIITC